MQKCARKRAERIARLGFWQLLLLTLVVCAAGTGCAIAREGLGPETSDLPPTGETDCTGSEPVCKDGSLTICDGGRRKTTACAVGCAPFDPTRCGVVEFSNLNDDLASLELSNVTLDTSSSFDTTVCSGFEGAAKLAAQEDGTFVCVLRVANLSIGQGVVWTLAGDKPLVILAAQSVAIDGVIDGSAKGVTPGPGGGLGGSRTHVDGLGMGGGGGGLHFDDGTSSEDGGGGGGGGCGAGGMGGAGGATIGPGDGAGGGGAAGAAAALDWVLSPLRGGSGGGAGSERVRVGDGGAGGGALQISSLQSIRLSGRIDLGGGGGRGGCTEATFPICGGGGGGSGGSLLLEAAEVMVTDTAEIRAGGGGGGGGGIYLSSGDQQNGKEGDDGSLHFERAQGGDGGVSTSGPKSGDGGLGGGEGDAAGKTGFDGYSNGGGGGGGGGCVVVRHGKGESLSLRVTPSQAPAFRILPVRNR